MEPETTGLASRAGSTREVLKFWYVGQVWHRVFWSRSVLWFHRNVRPERLVCSFTSTGDKASAQARLRKTSSEVWYVGTGLEIRYRTMG